VEANLDEVANPIELAIKRQRSLALGLRVNDSLDASRLDLLAELVRVVTGIADESAAVSVVEELSSGHHLVALARRQRDVERPAFRVDDRVDFGRKTSTRASQSILLDPPFPPDASW
jgi:hypothetical protein